VVCGTTIGRYAFVGAGSVVTHDVPDYALVYGNPARVRGWICACGIGLEFDGAHAKCKSCSAEYSKSGDQVHPVVVEKRGA
jgi:UDP-2-acetamido-3-amino-2,3-dideoxy-glucuronate N-acetyltransferase